MTQGVTEQSGRTARGRSLLRLGSVGVALSLMVAAAIPSASAAEGFGLFEALRNAMFGRTTQTRPGPSTAAPQTYRSENAMEPQVARPESDVVERGWYRRALYGPVSQPAHRQHAAKIATARSAPPTGASAGAGQTMCVRLCDGYAFPLGRLGSTADIPAHEAACASSCPGATTALYRAGKGGGMADLSQARSVADGTAYRQLASAFLYRKERVASCSCQGPDNVAALTPILRDPTLRSGDVVVDAAGDARVFSGETGPVHAESAFESVRRSTVISRKAQRQLDAMMGVTQREATARAFVEAQRLAGLDAPAPMRVKHASLQPVAAPAGSAAGVRAFAVVSAGPGVAVRSAAGPMAPQIYVIR